MEFSQNSISVITKTCIGYIALYKSDDSDQIYVKNQKSNEFELFEINDQLAILTE